MKDRQPKDEKSRKNVETVNRVDNRGARMGRIPQMSNWLNYKGRGRSKTTHRDDPLEWSVDARQVTRWGKLFLILRTVDRGGQNWILSQFQRNFAWMGESFTWAGWEIQSVFPLFSSGGHQNCEMIRKGSNSEPSISPKATLSLFGLSSIPPCPKRLFFGLREKNLINFAESQVDGGEEEIFRGAKWKCVLAFVVVGWICRGRVRMANTRRWCAVCEEWMEKAKDDRTNKNYTRKNDKIILILSSHMIS